jgi:hypothetical protein
MHEGATFPNFPLRVLETLFGGSDVSASGFVTGVWPGCAERGYGYCCEYDEEAGGEGIGEQR